MKRKVVMSLMIGAMSVSMLAGCGSDKEVTKVDDNTVQINDVSTEADNGTESTEVETEVVEEVSRDIVEELGIEVIEGSFLPEMDFIAGLTVDNEFTGETRNMGATVSIASTKYVAPVEDSDGAGGAGASSYAYVTDISKEPSKEGYVKTFFYFKSRRWGDEGFSTRWGAYDKNTGIALAPSKNVFEIGDTVTEPVTITYNGVEYDCIYESSFEYEEEFDTIYVTMAVEHPEEYASSNILFAIGSPTADTMGFDADSEDSNEIRNLRDCYEDWLTQNVTFYVY